MALPGLAYRAAVDVPQLSSAWVVVTMGNRCEALRLAVASILRADPTSDVVVVSNGGGRLGDAGLEDPRVSVVELPENLGAPGGRDQAVRVLGTDLVGFLDDDAELRSAAGDRIRAAFEDDPELGAVTLRLVDEAGKTQRRHLPRIGSSGETVGGEVTTILEGASVIRRDAYLEVGGYFTDLVYAHEALELCWRLIDRGWRIRYLADVEVFHPRTPISRHADGWFRTGRNRVWIARRTLPWPVAIVHVALWLAEGARRAPGWAARRAYVRGWVTGWRMPVDRRPISWRGVWRLTKLRRPPIV
jgi:hypothetical protein